MNFSKNNSPLAKLFYGYRKSHPAGLRNLIPGNKSGQGLYAEAKRWAQLFYSGDSDYQSDEKWYQAVLEAELPEEDNSKSDPTDPTTKGGDTPLTNEGNNKTKQESKEKSDREELYPGKKSLIKQEVYDLRPILNQMPYTLDIYNYWSDGHFKSPIIFEAKQTSKFNVYINNNHPLFKDFADGWNDLILMEVATKYYEKINDIDLWPVSRIYYELKIKYASDTMLDIQALVAKAKALVSDIQNFLILEYGEIQLSPIPELPSESIKLLKQNYLQIETKSLTNIEALIKTTKYLKYMDYAYVIDFIREYPFLIFDDKFFSLPFETLDEELKKRQFDQYVGYFNDIKWFIYDLSNFPDALVKQQKNLIVRNRFSLEYLNGKVV